MNARALFFAPAPISLDSFPDFSVVRPCLSCCPNECREISGSGLHNDDHGRHVEDVHRLEPHPSYQCRCSCTAHERMTAISNIRNAKSEFEIFAALRDCQRKLAIRRDCDQVKSSFQSWSDVFATLPPRL